jgi:hypothetical protein
MSTEKDDSVIMKKHPLSPSLGELGMLLGKRVNLTLLRQCCWHPGFGFGQHFSELLPLHNLLLAKEVGQFV